MRRIVHVDMDAFFAQVEQRDFPEYRGRPVVVGSDPREGKGRGVVSAASYEARTYGIRSALPISQAYRACPDAVFVRPRMKAYAEASEQIMAVFRTFSPVVEPLSIDEAFLDCSDTDALFGTDRELGKKIKEEVFRTVALRCSVGIASNKFIAKVASDLEKPDGLTICPPGREAEFLAPLPLSRLWGAGKKTVARLGELGYFTIGQIAGVDASFLENELGKWGRALHNLANGRDERPVSSAGRRKSISEERTFDRDTDDPEILKHTLLTIADRLSRRMRYQGLRGRTLTFKIRLRGFETHTRSRTLPHSACDMKTLRDFAYEELEKFPRNGKKIRLIGIGVSNLLDSEESEPSQPSLFDPEGAGGEHQDLPPGEKILDELRSSFGNIVTRASLLSRDFRELSDPGDSYGP